MLKKLLKRLLPGWVFLIYHYCLAKLATILYGFPAKKMVIIGITGTKGKTSSANFIWAVLTASGHPTGIISTANIRIGSQENLNQYHMTMPGRFKIQKLLSQMVKAGCRYAVVETTSEGIKQFRHIGVYYDVAVFTNLTPEHLQAHGGSFTAYKKTKGKLFKSLRRHHKTIDGQKIAKVIIANADDQHANYFLNFKADQKITYGLKAKADWHATNVVNGATGLTFNVKNDIYRLAITGTFNVLNALPALVIGQLFGVPDRQIAKGLAALKVIPGRMEKIDEGQPFTVIVDYAHEKQSITNVLNAAKDMHPANAKTIILLGAEGGGRDKAKRPIMGELAAKLADYVVVSNVDPYEDDPTQIAEDIAKAAEHHGKVRDENLFVILDRRAGIKKTLELAGKNDVVLITGKGAEQSIVIGGKSSPWDDRIVVREELKKLT